MKEVFKLQPRAKGMRGKRASRTGLMNWDVFLDSQSLNLVIAGEQTQNLYSRYMDHIYQLTWYFITQHHKQDSYDRARCWGSNSLGSFH